MELYAKGQLSYLILNCLLERDFYGLDIITEINSKSGGRVNLKKPSVYSNLTRMEKQGYVSSYSRSSELGPNRKYYSITVAGREFYKEIDQYFTRNNIDVFSVFDEEVSTSTTIQQQIVQENTPLTTSTFNEEFQKNINENENDVDDTEFFDFSGVDEDIDENSSADLQNQEYFEDLDSNKDDIEPENTISFEQTEQSINVTKSQPVQSDNYAFSIKKALLAEKQEEKIDANVNTEQKEHDDAKFLEKQQEVSSYNQRLYDISKDINSYKKKRSFAEDQISISAEAPLLSSSNERKRANLEEFKNSILQNKTSHVQNQNSFASFSNYKERLETYRTEEPTKEVNSEQQQDDGKFIVTHIDASSIEKPRKIEPPRLKILSDNGKEKLPAPKRDTSIDPSHQEILSQLYAKTKGSSIEEQREDCLYDYNDLKDFYKNQNISFDVYEKPTTKLTHNTNKLYFIMSLVTFLCASVASMITFIVLSKTSMLNSKFNFLYLFLPTLLLVDVGVKAYNMVKFKSWLPKQIIPHWKVWTITFALFAICVGLNFAFGMAVNKFSLFATTTILPILLILIVVPLRYYIKRYLLIHKWK